MISLTSSLSLKLYLDSLVYYRNIFGSSSKVFGNLRKSSDIFWNFRQMFGNVRLAFRTILENLQKSLEIFEKSWKTPPSVCLYNKQNITHYVLVARTIFHELTALTREMLFFNLIPRSLVDEAKGEIWQSKKICCFWLAAPFDSCPIPSLKIYMVFCGKLSSNSSSNLEISAVSEKEKPIRKDERRKNLEVICHAGLNNFCNMILPLPKSTRHPARALAPLHLPHMLFWHYKTLQTPSPVHTFFCAYEVSQSPHENKMSGANTRSV